MKQTFIMFLEIQLEFYYDNQIEYIGEIYFNVKLKDQDGNYFLVTTSLNDKNLIKKGSHSSLMVIESDYLNE